MRQWIASVLVGVFVGCFATTLHAEGMHRNYIRPTARQVKLDLLAGSRGYYWVYHGKILSRNDSIKIDAGDSIQFILTNQTNFDYHLNLKGIRFRPVDGYGTYGPIVTKTVIKAHRQRFIEFSPSRHQWFFSAGRLYTLNIDKKSFHDNAFELRQPRDLHETSRTRTLITPDVDWYNELNLASNMVRVDSVVANGLNSVEVFFEHDWSHEYYGEAALVRKFNNQTDFYAGYEWEYKKDSRDKRSDRGIVGLHYALPFIEADLRYDTDRRALMRLSTEVPINDEFLGYADWDTDHDYRLRISYKLAQNFYVAANYHSRYHGGVGVQVQF